MTNSVVSDIYEQASFLVHGQQSTPICGCADSRASTASKHLQSSVTSTQFTLLLSEKNTNRNNVWHSIVNVSISKDPSNLSWNTRKIVNTICKFFSILFISKYQRNLSKTCDEI